MKDEPRSHPFRDSTQDIEAVKRIPDTPQTPRRPIGWPSWTAIS